MWSAQSSHRQWWLALVGERRGGVEGVSIWDEAAGEEKPEEGVRRCCCCHMRMRLAAEMVAQCTAAWYAPEPFSFMGSPARSSMLSVRLLPQNLLKPCQ